MSIFSAARLFAGPVFLFAAALLVANQARAAQSVFLDFLTPSGPDYYTYSPDDKDLIKAGLEAIYPAPFGVTFSLTPPGGTHSTVFFNHTAGLLGGTSDQRDFLNTDHDDDAYIVAKPVLSSMFIPLTIPNILRASTNLAAHELGHILGLKHADSFGPPFGGVPAGNAGGFSPAYPGANAATTTTQHVMSLSTSIGLSPGNLLDPTIHFGFREAIKLKMDGHPEDMETPTVKTVPTAQPMSFTSISVPNTMVGFPDGTLFTAPSYSVLVDVVAGTLSPDPMAEAGSPITTDYYKFTGMAGEVISIEVLSESLAYRPMWDPTDPLVILLDDTSHPLPLYSYNDNEYESTDSLLLDITLPYTGTYYIEVGPLHPFDFMSYTGAYDLYMYRYNPIPEPGTLVLLGIAAGLLAVRRTWRLRIRPADFALRSPNAVHLTNCAVRRMACG